MSLPKELSEPMEPNATMRFIEELDEMHDRAIPIFGGALWIDPTDTERIVRYLPTIIRNAQSWNWYAGLADACRTFCHCLFIDPMLIEAYIGMKFEQLVEEILCLHSNA